ncbi:MAG: carbonic anhydrase, partial [Alphaproteobacteria bacterium]
IAGSAIGVTANKFKKWHKAFWDNIETSIKLHQIKKLIVINHRDCGAAKIINGNKLFDKSNETKIHKDSFKKIKFKFKKKYPKLKIELKLISLNKKIENF